MLHVRVPYAINQRGNNVFSDADPVNTIELATTSRTLEEELGTLVTCLGAPVSMLAQYNAFALVKPDGDKKAKERLLDMTMIVEDVLSISDQIVLKRKGG